MEYIGTQSYTSRSTGSASAVVSKPTNTRSGDIMFAFVSNGGRYSNSIPDGWIKVAQNSSPGTYRYFELIYKIAGDNEPSSYTFGFSGSSIVMVSVSTFRTRFDAKNPISVISNTAYTTSNTTVRAASMDVLKPNSDLLFFASLYNTSSTTFTKPSNPTTDWTEHYDSGSTGPDFWQEICSMNWASSGATGNMDAVASNSSANKHAFAIALNRRNTHNFFSFI